jgi:hypothetical protein
MKGCRLVEFSSLLTGDNYDKRFYGIYRGVLVDPKDPLDRGRIKLKVPQILGDAVTDWAWPATLGGYANKKLPYINLSSMTSQYQGGGSTSPGTASTPTAIKHEITEDSYGLYTDPTDPSKIYVSNTADYLVETSVQFGKSTSSSSQVDLWFRVNGTDIPRSNSRGTFQGNPNEILLTVPFIYNFNAGDYLQIMFSSSDDRVGAEAFSGLTAPTRPNIPSVITAVYALGNYQPLPGAGVWVMFEGGDPNFPLWLGEF